AGNRTTGEPGSLPACQGRKWMYHDCAEYRRAAGRGPGPKGPHDRCRSEFRHSFHSSECQILPVAARCARKLLAARLLLLVELHSAKIRHRFPAGRPVEAVSLLEPISSSARVCQIAL